jgi:hypothetical protein
LVHQPGRDELDKQTFYWHAYKTIRELFHKLNKESLHIIIKDPVFDYPQEVEAWVCRQAG